MAFLLKASSGCFKPIKNSCLHYLTPSFTRRFPVSCGFQIRELSPKYKIYYGQNNLHEIPFPHRLAPNPLINKGDILCVDYFSHVDDDQPILRFDAPGVGTRDHVTTEWNPDSKVLTVQALAIFLDFQTKRYDFKIQFDFDNVYYHRHDIRVHDGQIWVKLFRCRQPDLDNFESDDLLVYVPGDPHHARVTFLHHPSPSRTFKCDAQEEGMFYVIDY